MDGDALRRAVANAAEFWTRIARARGYTTETGDGWLAIVGDERYGTRTLTLGAAGTVPVRPGRVVVEDAFGALDLTTAGLAERQLPIMIRYPHEPADPPRVPVRRVSTPPELRTVERLVVEDFALEAFQPYQCGIVFPDRLLDDFEFYLAELDGEPVGASVAVPQPEAVGVYWVTTGTRFRSRGVGRSLMHALLRRFDDRPMTLTASKLGRPLYESLGFEHVTQSTWWVR
ncbi:GNAT family N-acetyltransferase [Dactylosporangium sp. NPDC051541]|uniref:GNAT family N-acetyltransferase n=1 Tax=Dactylosporangium sp. NPDC051541 TaxID=3363977 RepID=UPI0037A2D1BB